MAATQNVSISMEVPELEAAKAAAAEAGISLSAYMNQVARQERLRRNGRKYRELLDEAMADPEQREQIEAWDRVVQESLTRVLDQ